MVSLGHSINFVWRAGRWRSNVVCKYIRNFQISNYRVLKRILKIWLIGDELNYPTADEYFKNSKNKDGQHKTFTYNQFEVREFFTDSQSNEITHNSVSGRILNQLIRALNMHSNLPKLIVCVLDDDIVRGTRYHGIYFKQVYICHGTPARSPPGWDYLAQMDA